MNRIENLYVVAAEECSEIQQCISKILRFGENNYHPHTPCETNVYKLLVEYYQLQAVMGEIIQTRELENVLPGDMPERITIDKIAKVNDWAKTSEENGCIIEFENTCENSLQLTIDFNDQLSSMVCIKLKMMVENCNYISELRLMRNSIDANYNIGNLCDTDYVYLINKIYNNKLDELMDRKFV